MKLLRHPVSVGRRGAAGPDRIVRASRWAQPIGLITEIAIYTLYGAGVNLLVGYTGLVPFGASVFFGCATYAAAVSMLRFLEQRDRGDRLRRGVLVSCWRRSSASSSCAAAACISRC